MAIASEIGLGSGININALVGQLVASEGQPAFNAIQRQEDAVNTRLSGLGSLKSALSDFQSVIEDLKDGSLFKSHQATSSDDSILSANASAGSVAGIYSVEVMSLAERQKSISLAEFTDASEIVGTGTLSFASASGASFDLTIDATNNSLLSIRDAINSASDNDFVTASIINVDNATSTGTISKLVITSKEPGTENAFTVTGSDDEGLDDATGLSRIFTTQLDEQTSAKDAVIEVDGQTATRSTNSITDVLQGITLDLNKAAIGTKVEVNVTLDNQAIEETIDQFVSAYNALHSTTQSLGQFGGSTDGSGSGNGALIGDSTLRYVNTQIRQLAADPVSSAASDYNSLAMVGITIDKDGVMSLDKSELATALSANLQSVSDVFSSSDGVAVRLDNRLDQFLQSGGTLDSQESSLKRRLSSLQDRRDDVQLRLDNLQRTLLKQFTAMDVAVGQFNATGSFLNNWINQL